MLPEELWQRLAVSGGDDMVDTESTAEETNGSKNLLEGESSISVKDSRCLWGTIGQRESSFPVRLSSQAIHA